MEENKENKLSGSQSPFVNPDINSKIQQILEFCNKMPLKSKEAREKLAAKLIEDTFTTDPDEAWKEEEEEEVKSEIS